MKVYIAADHGGFKLKEKLKQYVMRLGYEGMDFGARAYKPGDDYPDYVIPLAEKVARDKRALGIVLCRNGQGVCIAANKVRGARAVTGFSKKMAASTRRDDNANVLCLPADYISEREAKEIVKIWLRTKFSGAKRHVRRLKQVEKFEGKQ